MKNSKSLTQRFKDFGKRETAKLTVPTWACSYGERISIHELRIADSIAVRAIYGFFERWLRPLAIGFFVATSICGIAFVSVRGMVITLGDAMYIPLTSDGRIVHFESLAEPIPESKVKDFVEKCLEGLYSLNSNTYQKTFKIHSNRCFSRSKQQKLAISVVESNIFNFIGTKDTNIKAASRARLVGFDVQSSVDVGQVITDQGYVQYGYEVRGNFTKYDMATGVKQVAPATFQVVMRNVVPFASPSGLSIISVRLKWDRPGEVETN